MGYHPYMDERISIYIAGLVDGDGCITSSNKTFRMSLSNTDKDMLDWLVDNTGLGNVNNHRVPTNPNWNPAWKWVVASRDELVTLLTAIAPYLVSSKKGQAELVLSYFARWPALVPGRGRQRSDEQMSDYQEIADAIRRLKTDRHYH